MFHRKNCAYPRVGQDVILGAAVVIAVALATVSTTALAQPPAVSQPSAEGAENQVASGRDSSPSELAVAPSESLRQSIAPPALRQLVTEVLERNPEIARAEQQAAAVAARAPQVRALPDPVAAWTLFVLPVETRVGAQRLSASIRQKFPWFGKLALKEQAVLHAVAVAEAKVETLRLDLVTETRRLALELRFLAAQAEIVKAEREVLARFEQAAQARYSAGTGLQQESVRIQAQITRVDTRLLEIAERRASLLASLNALRDRPADQPIEPPALPEPEEPLFDRAALVLAAQSRRPELAAAAAEIAAAETLTELAVKNFRPDVTFGLSYTLVEERDDRAGRINPPTGNGNDIVALTGSLNLPIWKRKLEAGVSEAEANRWAAQEGERRILASIERSIGDLTARMPLLFDHWRLLDTVLRVQAREALRSAETAYSLGKLNAVDLLDAEVVLFDVRIATARTRTDLAVAQVELERAVATPSQESRDHDEHK